MSEDIKNLDPNGWEIVTQSDVALLVRYKVEGGHLYCKILEFKNSAPMASTVFVPDVDLTRYQAHLREAYNQGFKDGAIDAHAQYQKAGNLANV
jgi:hypothetical protein